MMYINQLQGGLKLLKNPSPEPNHNQGNHHSKESFKLVVKLNMQIRSSEGPRVQVKCH